MTIGREGGRGGFSLAGPGLEVDTTLTEHGPVALAQYRGSHAPYNVARQDP